MSWLIPCSHKYHTQRQWDTFFINCLSVKKTKWMYTCVDHCPMQWIQLTVFKVKWHFYFENLIFTTEKNRMQEFVTNFILRYTLNVDNFFIMSISHHHSSNSFMNISIITYCVIGQRDVYLVVSKILVFLKITNNIFLANNSTKMINIFFFL